jgi:hypothetical protein
MASKQWLSFSLFPTIAEAIAEAVCANLRWQFSLINSCLALLHVCTLPRVSLDEYFLYQKPLPIILSVQIAWRCMSIYHASYRSTYHGCVLEDVSDRLTYGVSIFEYIIRFHIYCIAHNVDPRVSHKLYLRNLLSILSSDPVRFMDIFA